MIDPETATQVELDGWLAVNVMGWVLRMDMDHWLEDTPELTEARDLADWMPSSNRNHLALVLAKVPEGLRRSVVYAVEDVILTTGEHADNHEWFYLTADPEVVCRAIVRATAKEVR